MTIQSCAHKIMKPHINHARRVVSFELKTSAVTVVLPIGGLSPYILVHSNRDESVFEQMTIDDGVALRNVRRPWGHHPSRSLQLRLRALRVLAERREVGGTKSTSTFSTNVRVHDDG